jgi:hypothetical protein
VHAKRVLLFSRSPATRCIRDIREEASYRYNRCHSAPWPGRMTAGGFSPGTMTRSVRCSSREPSEDDSRRHRQTTRIETRIGSPLPQGGTPGQSLEEVGRQNPCDTVQPNERLESVSVGVEHGRIKHYSKPQSMSRRHVDLLDRVPAGYSTGWSERQADCVSNVIL